MYMSADNNRRSGRNFYIFIVLAALIFLTWLFYGRWSSTITDKFFGLNLTDNAWGNRGNFGDYFGSLETLFSGLAFAGVIYAILLQQDELTLQRKELKRSVEAQQESAKALERQIYEMQKQSETEEERVKREVTINIVQNLLTTYYAKIYQSKLIVENPPSKWSHPQAVHLDEVANWLELVALLCNIKVLDKEIVNRAGIYSIISDFYKPISTPEAKERLEDAGADWKEIKTFLQNPGELI
jgi:hypothetical protein